MTDVQTRLVLEQKVTGTILRCHCGPQGTAIHRGVDCPHAERIELGTLSYWHRNPLRRMAFRARQFISKILAEAQGDY